MKLDAVNRPVAMRDALNDAVLTVRVDAQGFGYCRRLQAQRMVSCCRERRWEAREDAAAVVFDA